MFRLRHRAAVLLLVALPNAVVAQDPGDISPAAATWIGTEAPELATKHWINLGPGEAAPTLESLRGKVVLLEFWATVRKACGKGLPHAQQHHVRLAPHGLEVLALSYDPPEALANQVESYGITVRLGSDISMADFNTYKIPSVPFSVVIGRDGRVLFRGAPELAEPALERALGLEADPGRVLTDVAHAAGPEEKRARLEWLVHCAPRAFDLAAFATERLGSTPAGEATSAPDATAALDAWVAAEGAGTDATAELEALVASGAHAYDLRRWAWSRFAHEAPIEQAEFDALVAARENSGALDALLFRAPSPELLQHAATSAAFVAHCAIATLEARALAKKALLAERWYLADVEPRSRNTYWVELGLGGPPDAPTAEGERSLVVGFERLTLAAAPSFFDEAMLRHLATLELSSGRAPNLDAVRARLPKERERMLRSAEGKHGAPTDH